MLFSSEGEFEGKNTKSKPKGVWEGSSAITNTSGPTQETVHLGPSVRGGVHIHQPKELGVSASF